MERLDAKIRHVWMASAVLTGLVLGILIGVVTYVTLEILWPAVPAVIVLVSLGVVYANYRYKNWLFEVHDDHLEIEYGVIRKVSVVVPYVRVQHIDTNRGQSSACLGLPPCGCSLLALKGLIWASRGSNVAAPKGCKQS